MFFRTVVVFGYRNSAQPDFHPEKWARLMIAGNFLAGIQWGLIGTVLYPATHNYREIFTVLVLTSYVAGSITAFGPVRWAHLALALPASLPPAIYIFFMREGMNWLAGGMALFFVFCILFFSAKQHRIVACRLKVELENEDLLTQLRETNQMLGRSIQEITSRTGQHEKFDGKLRSGVAEVQIPRTPAVA